MFHLRIQIIIIIVSIVALLMILVPIINCEKGGSDDQIEIFGDAGGSHSWNEIHGFVIAEDGNHSEEEFNVTLCENLSYQDDTWVPGGHIFGELHGIYWNEDPEPSITISLEDFEEFADDNDTLTIYLYGEYTHPSEGDRYAYKEITMEKPNTPPIPVAWFAVEGIWSWHNLSEESDVTVIIEEGIEGDEVTLWFNASRSWDPDGDNVTGWRWRFSDEFGECRCSVENVENISRIFSLGRSDDLALRVEDERGEASEALDFIIRVRSRELKPDISVGEIEYENYNHNKANYEVGDSIIIQPKIQNVGENDTVDPFKVLIEYSTDGGQSYTELVQREITHPIPSSNFELLTYYWDTNGFAEGKYIIRVKADIENSIDEEHEDNNENRTNLITLDGRALCCPILELGSVVVEKNETFTGEVAPITIAIRNVGDSDALYVDVYVLINGENLDLITFTTIFRSTNVSANFNFSSDFEGVFDVTFLVMDDGHQVGGSQSVSMQVVKNPIPIATIISISPNPAITNQSIAFTGNGSDEGVITGYHWRSSKDGYLSSGSSFSLSNLSQGTHTIYFKVRDDRGDWSNEVSVHLRVKAEKGDDGIISRIDFLLISSGILIICLVVIIRRKQVSDPPPQQME